MLAKLEKMKAMFTRPPSANDDVEGKSEDDFSDWTKSKLKFAPDKVSFYPFNLL